MFSCSAWRSLSTTKQKRPINKRLTFGKFRHRRMCPENARERTFAASAHRRARATTVRRSTLASTNSTNTNASKYLLGKERCVTSCPFLKCCPCEHEPVFRCVLESLYEGLFVRPSVGPSVTLIFRMRENAFFDHRDRRGLSMAKGSERK